MAYINLGQVIYPVGAIYSSASSISPGSMFGGGWVQITGDACLMAGNQAQYVGSKNITIANMPTHNHIGKRPQVVPSYYTGSGTIFGSALTGAWDYDNPLYTTDTGGGGGKQYLPYSYCCYMWRRTS